MDAAIRGVRTANSRDEAAIKALIGAISEFSCDDIRVACELLDITLTQPDQKDYSFLVAESNPGDLLGFLCYGPTPLTEGTFDLYWIGVGPGCAGQGVGRLLLQEMEKSIQTKGGHLVVIETTSAPAYTAARRFYLKNGYYLAETIHDFYHSGEDRLTFTKYF